MFRKREAAPVEKTLEEKVAGVTAHYKTECAAILKDPAGFENELQSAIAKDEYGLSNGKYTPLMRRVRLEITYDIRRKDEVEATLNAIADLKEFQELRDYLAGEGIAFSIEHDSSYNALDMVFRFNPK